MDFNDIADAFIRANLMGSPAELHGVLCGGISGGKHLSEDELVVAVSEFLNVEQERVEDLGDMLPMLYQFSELTGDIADALGDLASISHVGALEDEHAEEEDEVSYSELVEYVRVAVLLIYAELNVSKDHDSPTIH